MDKLKDRIEIKGNAHAQHKFSAISAKSLADLKAPQRNSRAKALYISRARPSKLLPSGPPVNVDCIE